MPKMTTNRYKQKQDAIEKFKIWENKTFGQLCDYYHSLTGIKKYQEQDIIEYYIDLFMILKQRKVQEIERELRKRNNERV